MQVGFRLATPCGKWVAALHDSGSLQTSQTTVSLVSGIVGLGKKG